MLAGLYGEELKMPREQVDMPTPDPLQTANGSAPTQGEVAPLPDTHISATQETEGPAVEVPEEGAAFDQQRADDLHSALVGPEAIAHELDEVLTGLVNSTDLFDVNVIDLGDSDAA